MQEKEPNKPTSIEEIVDTYPTELAMKVTEIVLNKEPNWSRRLEQLLTFELQETKKAERERINKKWLSLNLRNDNEENWNSELSKFGVFMQSLTKDN